MRGPEGAPKAVKAGRRSRPLPRSEAKGLGTALTGSPHGPEVIRARRAEVWGGSLLRAGGLDVKAAGDVTGSRPKAPGAAPAGAFPHRRCRGGRRPGPGRGRDPRRSLEGREPAGRGLVKPRLLHRASWPARSGAFRGLQSSGKGREGEGCNPSPRRIGAPAEGVPGGRRPPGCPAWRESERVTGRAPPEGEGKGVGASPRPIR